MTNHKTGNVKNGKRPAKSCYDARRNIPGWATSSHGSAESCRGFRSRRRYRFASDEGTRTLAQLFDGRSQLLIYHFMFRPSWEAGCPVCSSIADTINGVLPHLHARDVTMLLVSHAPLEKLQAYKRRMGWVVPWASSYHSGPRELRAAPPASARAHRAYRRHSSIPLDSRGPEHGGLLSTHLCQNHPPGPLRYPQHLLPSGPANGSRIP